MERKIITAIFVFVSLFAPMQNDHDTSSEAYGVSKELTIKSDEPLNQDFTK
jgi:hypothetical protein